jgi:hypothetical protein
MANFWDSLKQKIDSATDFVVKAAEKLSEFSEYFKKDIEE